MEWKVPASYCVQCGDLKRLCRCNIKAAIEEEVKESGFVQTPQEENGGEVDKVESSLKVSDKFDKVKQVPEQYRSKTREILKELENSSVVPPSSNSGLLTEEPKISENMSHSVYETFGVRLGSKKKSGTVEKMAQALKRDTSSSDGKCIEENESHLVSSFEESEPNKQEAWHVSDAIASKLVLFNASNQQESNVPKKISSSSLKGTTCIVCRRSVHPIEKYLGPKGELYHTNCLRCSVCNCLLDSSCLNIYENSFLCNKCFVKKPRSITNKSHSDVI
ncbi:hypothetical protein GpartN1_g1528.t1 [Galdieria partita]|uniref:LIM zinc-binding domain-containing protein n=1 Tax=Galdieria partita TaxID=83374 RepID=A0A9C7PTP2_9RHOD|nr:hypothetical protein GpartN1_g481.t1 [Galdieria partita]GJQ09737.1 hypothetical protein GpartN1_g1528.t1 [Galdieria partita]